MDTEDSKMIDALQAERDRMMAEIDELRMSNAEAMGHLEDIRKQVVNARDAVIQNARLRCFYEPQIQALDLAIEALKRGGEISR